MAIGTWQLQEAKNHFSEVVGKAVKGGPQTVTKHGKPAVVVISIEEYEQMKKPQSSLIAALCNCPEDLSDWIGERSKEPARSIRFH